MRGEEQIRAGFFEAQKAAYRNGHKGDWRHEDALYELWKKLEDKIRELEQEIVSEEPERAREELGDALWTLIMIVDHMGYLKT